MYYLQQFIPVNWNSLLNLISQSHGFAWMYRISIEVTNYDKKLQYKLHKNSNLKKMVQGDFKIFPDIAKDLGQRTKPFSGTKIKPVEQAIHSSLT